MAKRKQRHEEHPDERWLITYADVLTLMYVLFMVLFAISSVNTSRFELLKQSLTDAFNSGLAAGGTQRAELGRRHALARGRHAARARSRPRCPRSAGCSALARPRRARSSRPSQLKAAEKSIDAKLQKEGLGGKVSHLGQRARPRGPHQERRRALQIPARRR